MAVSASADPEATVARCRCHGRLRSNPSTPAALLTEHCARCCSKNSPLVVCIAAGIRVAFAHQLVRRRHRRRARHAKPAAFVGAGVSGLFAAGCSAPRLRARPRRVLAAVGEVVWLAREHALDVVTALSGSGPAYFPSLAEAMMQAARRPRARAPRPRGASPSARSMAPACSRNQATGILRACEQEVTSKGGTTEAALEVFAAADLSATVTQALMAAAAAQPRACRAIRLESATMSALIYIIQIAAYARPGVSCCCGSCCNGRAPTSATRSARRIVRVTNPLIVPLRRVLPPVGKIDTASVVAVILVAIVEVVIITSLAGDRLLDPLFVLRAALLEIAAHDAVALFLRHFSLCAALDRRSRQLLAAAGAAASLCEPVLRPFRRYHSARSAELTSRRCGRESLIQAILILLR